MKRRVLKLVDNVLLSFFYIRISLKFRCRLFNFEQNLFLFLYYSESDVFCGKTFA